MKVLKFGGTSVGSAQRMQDVCKLITSDGESKIVVLSAMSGTIVYSQVYNMMMDPTPYLGMVIRVAGYYDAYEDEEAGSVYHACVIPDATACCAQGIEFVWAGEHSYPEDYPEPGTDIVVTGQLETYEEGDYLYLRLGNAEVAEQ